MNNETRWLYFACIGMALAIGIALFEKGKTQGELKVLREMKNLYLPALPVIETPNQGENR